MMGESEDTSRDGGTIDRLIERFGGIRPMAAKLNIPVTTVQGWKKRSAIPTSRHNDIVAAADKHSIGLDGIDLAAAEQAIPDTDAGMEPSPLHTLGGAAKLAMALGGALILVALLLMLTGLYIVKQKTADLSHRINMVEQTAASGAGLEARIAALERQPHGTVNEAMPAGATLDVQQRLTDLSTQVGRVSNLSQKIEDLQSASGNREALQQTLGGLQQTVVALQGNLQALSQSVDGLKTHVGEIDTTLAQKRSENARQFAILLAINQLREAASTSEPFAAEMSFTRSLAHDDPEVTKPLDVLGAYSAEGVSTLNELRVEFSDLSSEIVRSNVVGDGKSWMRQALYRLGRVVSVRKIGSTATKTNTAETLVARAESRLEEDDLAGAVAALQGLEGLPKDVASAWVDSAQRRVAVDEALSSLSEISVKRLAAFQPVGGAKP